MNTGRRRCACERNGKGQSAGTGKRQELRRRDWLNWWDISTNHLGAIEREVKTTYDGNEFVKDCLNVLGWRNRNEVLKEVIPLTRMEHTSVVEGKLERLTPKKQESVLRMLDVIIEEMMK